MAALQCEICGGKLIGKAGGIFECDSCGMEYDTTWAKQKIQEIKGTVKVEGTVEVTGTVKLDGPVKVEGGINVENLLKRIRICAQDKEADRIKELADQVLNLDPECGEAYLWLLLVEKKLFNADRLFTGTREQLKELDKQKHWKNALRYLPREEAQQLENKLAEALAYWDKEDPAVLERSLQIQPAWNLVHEFYGCGLAALRADGGVYVAYCEKGKWLAPAAKWQGIRELVSNRFGMLLGLGWDGTVCALSDEPKKYKKIQDAVAKWTEIVALAIVDDTEYDVVVGLRKDGTLVSVYLDPYQNEGYYVYRLKKGDMYYALNAAGWTDVVHLNIVTTSDSGAGSGDNYCYAVLGLTADGHMRVSDTSAVPDIHAFWKDFDQAEQWKDIVKYAWGSNYQLSDGSLVYALGSKKTKEKYMNYPVEKGGVANIGIWGRSNEVKNVVACCSHAAVLADGTVVADMETKRARSAVQSREWTNMAAIFEFDMGEDALVGVREDGKVLLAWFDKPKAGIIIGDWKLFGSLETLEQERETARIHALEAARLRKEEEARRKEEERRLREEKARQKEEARRKAEAERQEKLTALRKEKLNLQNELANLKGLFTGRRRRELETQIAGIEAEMKRLS